MELLQSSALPLGYSAACYTATARVADPLGRVKLAFTLPNANWLQFFRYDAVVEPKVYRPSTHLQ